MLIADLPYDKCRLSTFFVIVTLWMLRAFNALAKVC